MNNKSMVYILIFIVIFFLFIDFLTLFFRNPNFTVEYYNSDIYVSYGPEATITTISGLRFKNEKKKAEYVETYKRTSLETFKKYFSEVSKEIGKEISVVDFKSHMEERNGIMEVTESVTLKGLVQQVDSNYILDMGQIQMNSVENASLKVNLPEDAKIETIEPTPTKIIGTMIVWSGSSIKTFPRIKFRRG